MKRVFQLVHAEARERALACVATAPDGWVVTVSEPTRTLQQNALMWPYLEAFSVQRPWRVNGASVYVAPEDWKDILTQGLRQEQRLADGIGGGVVLLGLRTSQMTKREFGDLIEYIRAVAVELGVDLEGAKQALA